MEELFAGEISVAKGLMGDRSPFSRSGEVTVLSKESWVKCCQETELEMPWLSHGANLFISGFEFLPTDIGRTLRIGQVVLEVIREMETSTQLDQQAPELSEALLMGWRNGVVCKVLRSGSIQTGHDVEIL